MSWIVPLLSDNNGFGITLLIKVDMPFKKEAKTFQKLSHEQDATQNQFLSGVELFRIQNLSIYLSIYLCVCVCFFLFIFHFETIFSDVNNKVLLWWWSVRPKRCHV